MGLNTLPVDFNKKDGSPVECGIHGRKTRCRSCAEDVYWVTTPQGRSMMVNAEPKANGLYESHFTTCQDASKWRKS